MPHTYPAILEVGSGREEGTGFSISGNPCGCRCVCYVHLPCQPDCDTCASGFVPEKGEMIRWEGRRKGERVAGKEIEEVKGGNTSHLRELNYPPSEQFSYY